MTVISQPDITLNIVPAQTDVSNTAQRVLFIGQKTADGTATAGELIQNIQNDNSWDTLFGIRSMLAQGIRAAREENEVVIFDAIAIDDPTTGNAAAEATVVFTGTATEDGSYTVAISSKKNHSYTVPVTTGDTADDVASLLTTLVSNDTKVPVTASFAISTGTATFTAANEGEEANSTPLEVQGSVAGLTMTTTAFTGGTGTVTLPDIDALIDGQRYQTIVSPYSYGTSVLTDILDPRFNTNNNVLDGMGITCAVDTLANLLVIGNAENSQSLTIIGENLVDTNTLRGASIIEQPYVRSCMRAGIRSLRLTDGQDISQYVIGTGGPLDTFGGPAIASLPYFNTPEPNLIVPTVGTGFKSTQVEQLLSAGISVSGANRARNTVIMGEYVTTYKTDSAGNPNLSFKYVNYVDTSSNAREYIWNNWKADFAQSRLTNGDVIAGRSMQNSNTIKSITMGYYDVLSGQDYVLLQAGETARKFFKNNMVVSVDLAAGEVQITMQAPIVTQLRTVIATMQVAFSIS